MHHATGDRSRPNDANLDDEIVESHRSQPWQHRHLGTAFDLEHTDRIALADHLVGRRILRFDRGDGKLDAAMLAQKLEAKIELRQTAETEQVDFKQTEI